MRCEVCVYPRMRFSSRYESAQEGNWSHAILALDVKLELGRMGDHEHEDSIVEDISSYGIRSQPISHYRTSLPEGYNSR
jgi:hypothetical protein